LAAVVMHGLAAMCAHNDNGSFFYSVCSCDNIIQKVVALCAVPVKRSSPISLYLWKQLGILLALITSHAPTFNSWNHVICNKVWIFCTSLSGVLHLSIQIKLIKICQLRSKLTNMDWRCNMAVKRET